MSIDTPPPAAKSKSTAKWLLFGITGILIILLLTNPNQTAHFTAIQEARKARLPAAVLESESLDPRGESFDNRFGLLGYQRRSSPISAPM